MNPDIASLKKELIYLIFYLVIAIPVLVLHLWLSRKARKEWMVMMGYLKPRMAYEWEKRQFVRLATVFPVEFQSLSEGKAGRLYEAFTKNVSKSGIQIECRVSHGAQFENVAPEETKLRLVINIPLYAEPVQALGTVKWMQKIEGSPADEYVMGISYDDIKPEDASRIIRYALWLYRKPAFYASIVAILILIIIVLVSFISDLRNTRSSLKEEVTVSSQEKRALVDRIKQAEFEKATLSRELESIKESETRLKKVSPDVERRMAVEEKAVGEYEPPQETETPSEPEDIPKEESDQLEQDIDVVLPVEEETTPFETAVEEDHQPLVTDETIKTEELTYKNFRDYILKEEMQRLDRYCYQQQSSIYHAAALFALAELRYKHRYDMDTIKNTYEELIRKYPESKYATYASHRLEQLDRRLSYGTYTLRYFYVTYDLPPLLDYREIQPYKK